MRKAGPGAAAIGCLLLLACGERSGSTPTLPQPGPGQELRLTAITPGPGATLRVMRCGMTADLCTRDLKMSVSVVHPQTVARASVFVEFHTADARRCAAGSSPEAALVVGSEQTFEVSDVQLSFPPSRAPLCPLPVTTSRMVVILVDVTTANLQRLFARDFDATYTFRGDE